MESTKKHLILDRIPKDFCSGPFWGNGVIGAILYIKENELNFAIDHVQLWEMRETLEDKPRATHKQIMENQDAYFSGNPDFVADTNIFDSEIGRTRLPGIPLKIILPFKVTAFYGDVDLSNGAGQLKITLENGDILHGTILLDSCVNIIDIKLSGKSSNAIKIESNGFNRNLETLKPIKFWNYPECVTTFKNGKQVITQGFSGDNYAVFSIHQEKEMEAVNITATLNIGEKSQIEELEASNNSLLDSYLSNTADYLTAHAKSWADYWNGFDIHVPNERLQEAFELEMYKVFCNERENSYPITLQGVWNPDNRMPAWFGDLHNDLNVQACYWAAFKTGNFKLVTPYIDFYFDAMERFKQRAKMLFEVEDAINIPTMMAPNGYGAASEWCFWNTLLGPELYVSVDFCWFYEYSQDVEVLKEKIVPFLRGAINLYRGIAIEKEDGLLHIPFTHSPEVFLEGRMLMQEDSTFIISSLHYLLEKLIEYSKLVDEDAEVYSAFKAKLTPVKTTEKGYPLFPNYDSFESHRHFCQAFPIFPLSYDAHSKAAEATLCSIINHGFSEYAAFSFPYSAIIASRCGYGNMARTMLELYCMASRSRNSFTVNGDPYQNGLFKISDTNAGESSDAFTLESGLMVPAALCEMFVHRAKNIIYILPAIPDEWSCGSCKGITVEGGHKLAISFENYKLNSVNLTASSSEKISLKLTKQPSTQPIFCKNGIEFSVVGKDDCYEIQVQKTDEITIHFQ